MKTKTKKRASPSGVSAEWSSLSRRGGWHYHIYRLRKDKDASEEITEEAICIYKKKVDKQQYEDKEQCKECGCVQGQDIFLMLREANPILEHESRSPTHRVVWYRPARVKFMVFIINSVSLGLSAMLKLCVLFWKKNKIKYFHITIATREH